MGEFRCLGCSRPVEVPDYAVDLAKTYGVCCPDCTEGENQAAGDPKAKRRPAVFSRLCPPCFDDTRIDRLPVPQKSALALSWHYGAKGLNLWGVPGTGKSRTASLLIHREVLRGRTVIALGPGGFREKCEELAYHRSRWLKALSGVELLFIDDIDKMNLTREMERDLFAVLNNRMGRLPTFVTGNLNGNGLAERFHLGAPLIDRIRRYCQNIYFAADCASSSA